jgi:CheY-like chemotaxis protein
MTIDDKLIGIGVKKMLVVDDKTEHIEAAKKYFKDYKIPVDYASSEKQAIEMIYDAYKTQKYDIVLSDMQMEKSYSGAEVTGEAFKHQGLGIIVTGQDAGGHGHHAHGPSTKILCGGLDKTIDGTKAHSDTWKQLAEATTEFIVGDGKRLYDALQRYHKYVSKPSDTIYGLDKL